MNDEYQKHLEQVIDRKLKRLGERQAPEELISRVLAAIAAQQARPWYRQSFQKWPRQAQFLFLLSAALLYAGVAYVISAANPSAAISEAARGSAVIESAGTAMSFAETLLRALKMLITKITLPWLVLIAGTVMFMSASALGALAAIVRLAFPQVRFNSLRS